MEEGYIFTGLLQEFGIVVCCIVVLMLARLLALLLGRILDQKNRLGAILGIGGFMALFLPLTLHLAINLGWLPVADSWMPFFAGGKSCIVFYMIMGMLLSIFRRQSCAPEPDAVTMQQN